MGYICLYWRLRHSYERIRADIGADVVRLLQEEGEISHGAPTAVCTRLIDATTLPNDETITWYDLLFALSPLAGGLLFAGAYLWLAIGVVH